MPWPPREKPGLAGKTWNQIPRQSKLRAVCRENLAVGVADTSYEVKQREQQKRELSMGLVLLIVFFSSIWVYFDAKSNRIAKGLTSGFFNLGPAGWFWVCLLLWIVGFPSYLAKRGSLKRLASERAQNSPSPRASSQPVDSLAQLEKLGELRQKGVLTDAEFDEKKKELLARSVS
jgi:hypothetical protein